MKTAFPDQVRAAVFFFCPRAGALASWLGRLAGNRPEGDSPHMPKSLMISLLLSLAAAPLYGQTAGTEGTLDSIEVTAARTDLDKRLIPFSVYSVTSEEYRQKPSGYYSSVGTMVQDLPGVNVGEFFPWGMPWIQLRGTGDGINRTVWLVDGLPVYVWQGSTLNSHDIGRADVLLGPSSALYGSNASGGVLNLITKSGHEGMGVNVELAYGSRGTLRPHLHFGGAREAAGGAFRWYVSYSGDFSDGYIMQPYGEMMKTFHSSGNLKSIFDNQVKTSGIENNNYRYHYFATRLDWENDEESALSLSINYATKYQHGGQPNFTTHDNDHNLITSVRGQTRVGDWGKLKLAIGFQSFENHCDQTDGFVLNQSTGEITFSSKPTVRGICVGTGNRKHLPIDLQLDIKPAPNDTITLGFFFSKGWVNTQDSVNIDKTSPSYGQKTLYFRFDETQYSFYAQNAITLLNDKLSFLAGLRWDHWKYDNIYNMNYRPDSPLEASFHNLSFRSGAKYWINENIGLHLAYGTAYYQNPQNLFTAGYTNAARTNYRHPNSGLKPEKTWMAEFGVDFVKPEWGTEAYLTLYKGEIKDVQYAAPAPCGAVQATNCTRAGNNGLVKIHGVELSLSQELIPDTLRLSGSATFNYSRIKQDQNPALVGNHLRNAPDFSASVNLLFTKPDLFNFSVSYRHTDDRYYSNNNEEYAHYHMRNVDVLDAKIWRDWELSDGLTMTTQLSATNITNLSYEGLYTYMAPGRYIELLVGFTTR
jgi:iron complex outermembrane receptor protein